MVSGLFNVIGSRCYPELRIKVFNPHAINCSTIQLFIKKNLCPITIVLSITVKPISSSVHNQRSERIHIDTSMMIVNIIELLVLKYTKSDTKDMVVGITIVSDVSRSLDVGLKQHLGCQWKA
nr:hypothetical protein CFP56_47433 [Quercus suber]POE88880.1 hypothetical protein CFP56_47434 [Quercus suber]